MNTKFWITVISKNHVIKGMSWGIVQVCHGKKTPLKRIKKGDFILFYSSKINQNDKTSFQKFTAIAKAIDDKIYQVEQFKGFEPFRRKVNFIDCQETAIRPLINDLDFIPNKKSWGYPFRYGLLEISKKDFKLVTSKMLYNYE